MRVLAGCGQRLNSLSGHVDRALRVLLGTELRAAVLRARHQPAGHARNLPRITGVLSLRGHNGRKGDCGTRLGVRACCSSVRPGRLPRETCMIEHVGGAVIPTGFDVPVEPLRRAAHYTGEQGCIAEARSFTAHFVDQLRTEWCARIEDRAVEEVLLVVSELVTNADRHSN